MSEVVAISEATIRRQAGAEAFARGQQYAQAGAVSEVIQRGRVIDALVAGSQPAPYRVRVTVEASGDARATCVCPAQAGGWCKHIVAVLLILARAPDQVITRPTAEEMLAGLDRDHLRSLLLHLIDRDPEIITTIEAQLALQPPTAPASAMAAAPAPATVGAANAVAPSPAPARRAAIDPEPLRRQMRAMFRAPGAHQYGYAHTVVSQVGEHLQTVDELSQSGDAQNALRLLEVITAEYTNRWFEVDDSGGNLGDFFSRIGRSWAYALLCDDLPPTERAAWGAKLEVWEAQASDYGIEEPFELARAAAAEGWDDPDLERVLRGEVRQRGTPVADLFAYRDRLSTIRLDILARQGRYQEYLYLAEASGELDRFAVMLARVGRAEEALREGLSVLRRAPEALALATVLHQQGHAEEALRIAQHGLTLAEPRGELATWLRDLAASLGHPAVALAAAEAAVRSDPSLANYLKVAELAGPAWPERQPALLSFFRGTAYHWNFNTAAVDVFLHEGLIDDAIALVERGVYHGVLARVMDAIKTTRPEWVIATAKDQAERIMSAAKASHYDEVVTWLYYVQDAYRALGREPEWTAYLDDIRARHGRKYKLMGFIDRM